MSETTETRTPYGTKEPIHRYNTTQEGVIIIENLPVRDRFALLGNGVLSTMSPVVRDGRSAAVKTFAIEGVNMVDVSSDAPLDSIILGVPDVRDVPWVLDELEDKITDIYAGRRKIGQ